MPDRRGFLGAVAALVAAPLAKRLPWLDRRESVVRGVDWGSGPDKTLFGFPVHLMRDDGTLPDTIYFLDPSRRIDWISDAPRYGIVSLPRPVGVIRNLMLPPEDD